MRKLLIIGLVLLLASCSKEEITPFPCLDGNCDTNFWIDTNVSPGTYEDENGLVISTNEFEKVAIRHMGYDFEELQKQITEMVEQLPLTVESMNKMIDTQMNQKSILKFAKDMLAVRFPEDELRRITIDMDEFITPVRPEDKGDDLWSVFNTIQEKIIEGDFEYTVGTKHRKARQIKNFKQDMDLNSKMFDVALEYVTA